MEDLILNYCVIISTSIILNRITKIKKVFLSSVIGLIPLVFLFSSLNKFMINIINLIFMVIMSLISFGYKDFIYMIRNTMYIYFTSIFLAGSVYLLNVNFLPKVDNYFLNFIVLCLIAPIVTYWYIKSVKKIKIEYSNYYKLDIYLKDKSKVTVNSYLDTGNILKDPYGGKPIILINKKYINDENEKIILVPYNTIDNQGLLRCFKPEKIYIYNVGYRQRVLVGLIDEVGISGADCIMNKELLERI